MYNYLDYLPEYLRQIRELQILGSCADTQLEDIQKAVQQVFGNQFISTADTATLERWESIYALAPGDTLINRRQALLAAMKSQAQMNTNKLLEQLRAISRTDVRLEVYPDEYRFEIFFAAVSAQESNIDVVSVRKMVDRAKPANLYCEIKYEQGAASTLYFAGFMQVGKIFEIRQVN